DRAGEERGEGQVPVPREPVETPDRTDRQRATVHGALDAGGQGDLPLRQRGVEPVAGGTEPVAERVAARPEVDASGGLLARSGTRGSEGAPTPGPDRPEPALAGDLPSRERLQLDEPQPLARGLQPFAATGSEPGLEADDDPKTGGGDAERREVGDRV